MTHPAAAEILTDAECWALLERQDVGRLAVDVGGRPDIFPINHVVADGRIVFKTGAGTKFAGAVLGRHVAYEIDGQEPDTRSVWSVVVKGIAHEIDRMEDRFEAEDLPLYPWVTAHTNNYVRIEPELVTGRRFHVLSHADMGEVPTDGADAGGAPVEYHPGAPRLRPD